MFEDEYRSMTVSGLSLHVTCLFFFSLPAKGKVMQSTQVCVANVRMIVQSKPLNVEYLMMDASILLPPTGTPLTGIDFVKRLPCGDMEKTRRVGPAHAPPSLKFLFHYYNSQYVHTVTKYIFQMSAYRNCIVTPEHVYLCQKQAWYT